MAFNATILAAVDAAFIAVTDKVTPAVFTEETVSGFDFSTGQKVSATSTVTVDSILLKSITKNSETPSDTDHLIVKTAEVNPSLYNSVVVLGDRYNVVSFTDNHYIVKFTIIKDR